MYMKTTCPCCRDVNYIFVSMRLTESSHEDGTVKYSLDSAESRDVIPEDDFVKLIITTLVEHRNVLEKTDITTVLRKTFGVSKTDCPALSMKVKTKLKQYANMPTQIV